MKIITRQEMQRMERSAIRQHGIPSLVLMENAGRAVSDYIIRNLKPPSNKTFSILCGKGNNAGDGLVIARHLQEADLRVKVYLLSPPETYVGDAKVNLHRLALSPIPLLNPRALKAAYEDLKNSFYMIDAIFGTGLDRPVRGFWAEAIRFFNSLQVPKLSLDIPSGLCADTGKVLGEAVRARMTCTFHLPKKGLVLGEDIDHVGELLVFPIGIPKILEKKIKRRLFLITPEIFSYLFRPRAKKTHKNDYGHVLTVAGSKRKLGAALLAARSALRSGAGLSSLALPDCAYQKIDPKFAEIMFEPLPDTGETFSRAAIPGLLKLMKHKTSLACGPGMGVNSEVFELVKTLVKKSKLPLVLDADALNNLAKRCSLLKQKKTSIVLTPHPGEMQRLTGLSKEMLKKRVEVVRRFAKTYGVYVLLKGDRSLVGSPEGDVYVNATGNPGMATAGTGDVLTGMIAGFIAQKIPFEKALLASIWIHGRAGDLVASKRGEAGMLAFDIAEKVPEVILEILQGSHGESKDRTNYSF